MPVLLTVYQLPVMCVACATNALVSMLCETTTDIGGKTDVPSSMLRRLKEIDVVHMADAKFCHLYNVCIYCRVKLLRNHAAPT